jgi:hypothetical protein
MLEKRGWRTHLLLFESNEARFTGLCDERSVE